LNYSSLAGTNLSSQDKHQPIISQAKQRPSSTQKARYDLMSSIPTLPGYLNNRDDSRHGSGKRAGEFSARNSHNSQNTTPTERPSTYRQYKNEESLISHDQSQNINPMSRPRKASDMREKLLAQSTQEYFGIQGIQHKKSPVMSNNAFKSSLELR